VAWFFGDGFDLYAAPADAYMGGTYWDSGAPGSATLGVGRFAGSRAFGFGNGTGSQLLKNSGTNEAVHHVNIAVQITSASLSGTTTWTYLSFGDGATAQCSIVFRSDGAILLQSGGPSGSTLATYTGAITAAQTWYGFEFEIVVNNTTGSFAVRKNGNTINDFSATSLNTRTTANNYANRLTFGNNAATSSSMLNDDFLWRSDASSVAWVGDIRCYTRMPASDQSVQWTPSGSVVPVLGFPGGTNASVGLGTTAKYLPFTAVCDGTIGSLSLQCVAAVTANIKCTIFAGATGAPTTILGSANLVTNPGIGTTTFTFATPVAVSRGVQYYAAFCQDALSGNFAYLSGGAPPGGYAPLTGTGTYATFPVASPGSLSGSSNYLVTVNITPTAAINAPFVADTMQDAAASYVSSSTVSQSDLYGIAAISSTPSTIVGVVTRGLCQKTDAGTRNVAVQLKSGATTVQSASTALNTSWGWISRTDTVDPATGTAWTATGVNNAQIGAQVTA